MSLFKKDHWSDHAKEEMESSLKEVGWLIFFVGIPFGILIALLSAGTVYNYVVKILTTMTHEEYVIHTMTICYLIFLFAFLLCALVFYGLVLIEASFIINKKDAHDLRIADFLKSRLQKQLRGESEVQTLRVTQILKTTPGTNYFGSSGLVDQVLHVVEKESGEAWELLVPSAKAYLRYFEKIAKEAGFDKGTHVEQALRMCVKKHQAPQSTDTRLVLTSFTNKKSSSLVMGVIKVEGAANRAVAICLFQEHLPLSYMFPMGLALNAKAAFAEQKDLEGRDIKVSLPQKILPGQDL